ncbi:hypothetical protein SYNPS1DRAFT_28892 [Syncephalis pseudoplumigaleata]|uniref:DOMON domain-containing protein n=1 Tax=Syncephalis pseudoplumigaleata TaxID=1712513 RepID=A0A4P9YZ71_9FUNG|nr:hypothetical protein SYNPS1DRAFT_28892 [Syncephalis pseudoplumigaleata]|eukprot:RKP25374.1 hypothetical protein SYNPS1DRAFT_28892 [Syncephalis pseudoplumigaleata]
MKYLACLAVGLWTASLLLLGGVRAQGNHSTQASKYSLSIDGTAYPYSQTVAIEQFSVFWSIDEAQRTVSFAVQVNADSRPGWVGFGISPTGGMVGSRVVVAAQDTAGRLSITEYQLAAKSSSGLRAVAANARVTSNAVASFARDQPVTLAFTQRLDPAVDGISIARDAPSNVVVAIGNAPSQGGRIPIHTAKESASLVLNSPGVVSAAEISMSPASFMIIHGVLMAVGWLIMVPIGMVFGSPAIRRRLFPNNKSSNPPYTRAHRQMQLAAFMMITTAFIIAIVTLTGGVPRGPHGVLGLVVYGLLCLQMGTGMARVVFVKARPARNATEKFFKRRKQGLIKTHFWLGTLLLTLAVVNIFLGIRAAGLHFGLYIAASIIALLGGAAFFWSSYLAKKLGHLSGEGPRKPSQTEQAPSSLDDKTDIETAGTA